jgi:hypothetical protein
MNHLTPDELIDAVDGSLAPDRHAHLTDCRTCRAEDARVRAVLEGVKAVDVPEPSPLFWDHLAARVRQAIDREAAPKHVWLPVWARWQVLAPIAALALLVMLLASSLGRTPAGPAIADTSALAAPDDSSAMDEQEWAVVTEIVGSVSIDRAHDAGIAVNPGDADRLAQELSSDEQRELVRLIKAEMEKTGG